MQTHDRSTFYCLYLHFNRRVRQPNSRDYGNGGCRSFNILP